MIFLLHSNSTEVQKFLCSTFLLKGTDKSFLRQCQYHHKNHPNFKMNKIQGNNSFTIAHFAGEIVYDVSKNKMTIVANSFIDQLIIKMSCFFV